MTKHSYLSVEELAKRFGVNTTTVYRLTKRGRLPGFKVGNQWRFSQEILERWIRNQLSVACVKTDNRNRKSGEQSTRL